MEDANIAVYVAVLQTGRVYAEREFLELIDLSYRLFGEESGEQIRLPPVEQMDGIQFFPRGDGNLALAEIVADAESFARSYGSEFVYIRPNVTGALVKKEDINPAILAADDLRKEGDSWYCRCNLEYGIKRPSDETGADIGAKLIPLPLDDPTQAN